MAISNNYVPVKQLGNGVTVAYGASWPIFAAAYIRVYLEDVITGVQVLQVQGTNYTLTFDDTGFVVTFLVAPPNTKYVVIGRAIEQDQTNPYKTSKGFDGSKIEGSYDKLTGMVQDMSNALGRSLKFPLGSAAIGVLPTPVDQAALVWSGTSGTMVNGPLVTDIANAAANAAIAVAAANQAVAAATNAPVYNCPTVTGTNTIALTTSATVTSYTNGQIFEFVPVSANTGAATANVNGIGASPILDQAGAALTANAFIVGVAASITRQGSNFYLVQDARTVTMPALSNDFRLTLTSGLPVTTADVTGAGIIYCTPYKGNKIALYDGANWNVRASAQFSLALSALTVGRPYDVFCYDNAGVPTLEFLAWTNDTTRATALVYQDGILSKTGQLTRRYMGTFYTTAAATTEDSTLKRYLFNYYNRAYRSMAVKEAAANWAYSTNAFRQANGSAANQVSFIRGVSEDAVSAMVQGAGYNTAGSIFTYRQGIGLDSTTVDSSTINTPCQAPNSTGSVWGMAAAHYRGTPAAGKHDLVWLEGADGTANSFFIGTSANGWKCGLTAEVWA